MAKMWEVGAPDGYSASAESANQYIQDQIDEGHLPSYVTKTIEEQLDWILSETDGIGEEVLCDYLATIFVAQVLGDHFLPMSDSFVASYLALSHLGLWQTAELLCRMHFAPDLEQATESLRRLTEEIAVRRRFMYITVLALSNKNHLQELYKTDLDGDDFTRAQDERTRALMATLDQIDKVNEEMLAELNMNPLVLHMKSHMAEMTKHQDLLDVADGYDIGSLVGSMTGIGGTFERFQQHAEDRSEVTRDRR